MGIAGRNFAFVNQFDTDLCKHVTKISPITMRFGKCVASDSGSFKYKEWEPGQPVYGNITFEGYAHPKTFGDIQKWVKDCYDGKEIRKTLTINLREHQKDKPYRSFTLKDAFPQRFNYVDVAAEGNAGTVVHWTLEVRVDEIMMA